MDAPFASVRVSSSIVASVGSGVGSGSACGRVTLAKLDIPLFWSPRSAFTR